MGHCVGCHAKRYAQEMPELVKEPSVEYTRPVIAERRHSNLAVPLNQSELEYMNLPQGVCRPIQGTNALIYYKLNTPQGLSIVKTKIYLQFKLPWFAATAQFSNFLFICGGADRGTVYNHESLRTVHKFDLVREEPADILPGLMNARTGACLVAHSNSHLVVIGGCRDLLKNSMKSCEQLYNGCWTDSFPGLKTARIFAAAVQFKASDIYVFCGTTNGYQSGALDSIEHYKAAQHRWVLINLPPNASWRPRFSVSALNFEHGQDLLIFGGSDAEAPCFHFEPKSKSITSGKQTLRKKNNKLTATEIQQDQSMTYQQSMSDPEGEAGAGASLHHHSVAGQLDREHDNDLIKKIVQATNKPTSGRTEIVPLHTEQALLIQKQRAESVCGGEATTARKQVKSDTTHSDMSLRKPRFRTKTYKQTVHKNISHSPTARRVLSSPYLKHVNKASSEYKLITHEKSRISHFSSSAITEAHSMLGKKPGAGGTGTGVGVGVSHHYSTSKIYQIEPDKQLVFNTLAPIQESIYVKERPRKISRRVYKNCKRAFLQGIDGYMTPVVPIVQLGLHLTIARTVSPGKEDEWELCWFDNQDKRWRIGAEWLADELKVEYSQEIKRYEGVGAGAGLGGGGGLAGERTEVMTYIPRTKESYLLVQEKTENSEMKDVVPDFANFHEGIKGFPIGSSSFYSSVKKESFMP